MRRVAVLLTIAVAAVPAWAVAADNPGFEKLKTLAGEWQASMGEGHVVKASYEVVSGGSAVMERLTPHDGGEMITIYHPDGKRILLTHYCHVGNQPRMRCESQGADAGSLGFKLVEVTNLKAKDEFRMSGLVVRFQDADHFSQTWTSSGKGKEQPFTFNFERVK